MTDQDLLHHLRNNKGWPTLGNAAADRIEELIAERDRAAQEARAVALEEAATIANACDLGLGNEVDRVARTIRREILALIDKPAAAALERVRAEERAACLSAAQPVADARIAELQADNAEADDPYGDGLLDEAVSLSAAMLAAIQARGET